MKGKLRPRIICYVALAFLIGETTALGQLVAQPWAALLSGAAAVTTLIVALLLE